MAREITMLNVVRNSARRWLIVKSRPRNWQNGTLEILFPLFCVKCTRVYACAIVASRATKEEKGREKKSGAAGPRLAGLFDN